MKQIFFLAVGLVFLIHQHCAVLSGDNMQKELKILVDADPFRNGDGNWEFEGRFIIRDVGDDGIPAIPTPTPQPPQPPQPNPSAPYHRPTSTDAEAIRKALSEPFTPSVKYGAKPNLQGSENWPKYPYLVIAQPGIYENFVVDGGFSIPTDDDIRCGVHVLSDNVILRNFIVRNCNRDGIKLGDHPSKSRVSDIRIENGRVEYCLNVHPERGIVDTHGITGSPTNCKIFNVRVYGCSGDGMQFDPDYRPWQDIEVRNCTFVGLPLDKDCYGPFVKGLRPGENGIDLKQGSNKEPSRINIENCVFYGFEQPARINLPSALNLKLQTRPVVKNCLVFDSQIGFRLRGHGDGTTMIAELHNNFVYDCEIGFRTEDRIRDLQINGTAFGSDVQQPFFHDSSALVELYNGKEIGTFLENIRENDIRTDESNGIVPFILRSLNPNWPKVATIRRIGQTVWTVEANGGYYLHIKKHRRLGTYLTRGLTRYQGSERFEKMPSPSEVGL